MSVRCSTFPTKRWPDIHPGCDRMRYGNREPQPTSAPPPLLGCRRVIWRLILNDIGTPDIRYRQADDCKGRTISHDPCIPRGRREGAGIITGAVFDASSST